MKDNIEEMLSMDIIVNMAKERILESIDVDAMVKQYLEHLPQDIEIVKDIDNRIWGIPYRQGIENVKKHIENLVLTH